MAVKRKNTTAALSPAERQEKRKLRHGIVLLVSLVLLIAGITAGLIWLNKRMFEENKHFTLRRVEIVSSGFYGKSAVSRRELVRRMNVTPGQDNLFRLDVKKLREELRTRQPNIEDAQVAVVLPDTLYVKIEERIPRAFLGRPNSPLVADANCMIMRASESLGVHPNLPVIVGMPHHALRPGERHEKLREALNLIMTVQRYRCFSVAAVNLSVPDELFVIMDYRAGNMVHRYRVTMPRKNYPENLDILQSAISEARKRGSDHSRINLTFDGQVVLSR